MNDKKKFSLDLTFSERIQIEDSIKDIHIYSFYKTIEIGEHYFDKTSECIKKDLWELLEKY